MRGGEGGRNSRDSDGGASGSRPARAVLRHRAVCPTDTGHKHTHTPNTSWATLSANKAPLAIFIRAGHECSRVTTMKPWA